MTTYQNHTCRHLQTRQTRPQHHDDHRTCNDLPNGSERVSSRPWVELYSPEKARGERTGQDAKADVTSGASRYDQDAMDRPKKLRHMIEHAKRATERMEEAIPPPETPDAGYPSDATAAPHDL